MFVSNMYVVRNDIFEILIKGKQDTCVRIIFARDQQTWLKAYFI